MEKFEELTGAVAGSHSGLGTSRSILTMRTTWAHHRRKHEVLGSTKTVQHKAGRFKDMTTLAMLPNVREKYVFDDNEEYQAENMHCREQNCHSLGYFRLRTDDDKKHYVVHNDADDSSDED